MCQTCGDQGVVCIGNNLEGQEYDPCPDCAPARVTEKGYEAAARLLHPLAWDEANHTVEWMRDSRITALAEARIVVNAALKETERCKS